MGGIRTNLVDSYDNVNAVVTTKTQAIYGTQLGMRTVGAHFDAKGNLDVPSTAIDAEIKDKAAKMFPNNPDLATQVATHAIQTAHGELLRQRYSEKQDDTQNLGIIQDAIIKGNNGQPWKNEQELTTANPDVATGCCGVA